MNNLENAKLLRIFIGESDKIGSVNSYVRYGHSNEHALNAAMSAAINAVDYLKRGTSWREVTAFILGTLTHFIGDLSFPPHIYRPSDPSFRVEMNNQVSRKTIQRGSHCRHD